MPTVEELHDAEKAVSDLRELRDWTQMLNTSGFAKVAAAFGCLASLKRSHRRDTQNPRSLPPFSRVHIEVRLYDLAVLGFAA